MGGDERHHSPGWTPQYPYNFEGCVDKGNTIIKLLKRGEKIDEAVILNYFPKCYLKWPRLMQYICKMNAIQAQNRGDLDMWRHMKLIALRDEGWIDHIYDE